MKNLASVLTAAALATALAGCETNPSKPDTDNGSNAPRALGATTVKPTTNNAPTAVPPAVLKWNDESCNKDGLTENKIRTDAVCVRIIESGVSTSKTKPSGSAPAPTAYALKVSLSECGVTHTAGGLLQSAGGLLGGLAGKLGAAATAGANRVAGGGIAGRAAGEATTAVTGSTTQRGQAVANDTQKTLTDACKTQITNFISDDFKPAIAGLSKAFGEAHPGYKAVYNVTSELPEVHNKALQMAAGQTAPTRGLERK